MARKEAWVKTHFRKIKDKYGHLKKIIIVKPHLINKPKVRKAK